MKRPAAALLGCIAILLLIAVAGVATIPTVPTGTWQPMGSMAVARSEAAAVLLEDHRVLIVGGNDANGPVNTAEVFNADGSFASVSAMATPRSGHVAVQLMDGRALVAGGVTAGGGATNSAEIYDPGTDRWTSVAGGMVEARTGATASVLQSGRVLIAGGRNGSVPSSTVEIFDPASGNFSFAGTLSSPRMGLASAMLADGRVLITGGSNGSVPVGTSDVFDPTTNTVSAGPAMTSPRVGHSATALLDGRVLVTGGNNGSADLASAEVFDPAVGGFAVVASSLAAPRRDHTAILLPNSNAVLIVGGTSAGSEVATAETYVPWTGGFAATGAPAITRQQAATSALNQDGLLLMTGGSSAGAPVSSAELYGFATVKTDAADYAPGDIVTITGSGWQPGETVTLTLVEAPYFDAHPVMTAVADGQGRFTNAEFSPDEHDLGIRFYVTAVGNQSGNQAQNSFTDANPNTVSITSAQNPNPVQAGSSASYGITVTFNGNNTTSCTVDLSATPSASPAWPAPPVGGFFSFNPPSLTSLGAPQNSTFTITTPANMTANTYGFTVTATPKSGTCQNNNSRSVNGTLVVVPGTVPTTLTLNSVSPNNVAFGSAGPVTFTATLTRNDTSAVVAGATANFTVDGAPVGSAVTNASGVATFNTYSPSALSVGSHTVAASFSTATIGGTQFASSTSNTLTLSIGKATPTITWATPADITYGTALGATQLNATASVAGSFVYTPAAGTVLNAGNGQTLHVDFTPTDTANYSNAAKDVMINVNRKSVTASIIASDKPYDGNNTANITSCTIPGKIGSDDVGCTASNATFASANASVNPQTVTATVALTGATAGNYSLSSTTATTSAKITPKPVTATLTADDKAYDGNASEPNANLHCTLPAGSAVGTDDVGCAASNGTFNSSQVALANQVTATVALTGLTAGNYSLTSTTATATAHIKTAPLTATLVAADKVYDGATTEPDANMSCTVSPVVSGDTVACGATNGSFNSKDVASATTVTATVSISGGAAGNYTLGTAGTMLTSTTASASAHITPKPVTATLTADDKAYDGNASEPNANLHCTLPAGSAVGTDDVGCAASNGTFNSSQVALANQVTATVALTGLTAGNYSLTSTTATATAHIKTAPLTATLVAADKVYDGATTEPDANMSCTVSPVVSGDTVACGATNGSFNSKDVASATTVTATVSISGGAASNYTLGASGTSVTSTSASASAHITPKTATASITADDKVYDGLNTATIHCTLAGVLAADNSYVSCGGTGTFIDANAGAGKAVTANNLSLSGSAAPNYVLASTTASTTASILTKPLTATLTAQDKTYDKTTAEPNAAISCSVATLVGTDNVLCTATNGSFNSAEVLSANLVTATATISGTAVANYTLGAAGTSVNSTTTTATAHIRTAPLTATLSAMNKVYDGGVVEPDAKMSCTVSPVFAGDVVSCTASNGTFNSKDVVTATTVTANVTIGGASASNYTLGLAGSSVNSQSATTAAQITPAPLTIQAGDKTKVFGQALPPLTATYITLLGADTPASLSGTLICTTSVTALSSVGNYPNSINCSGQSSTNYTITYQPGSLTVTQASTSVVIVSSANPSGLNGPVTFTATVSPQFSGTPTGTVTFTAKYFNAVNPVTIGTATLNGSGVAALSYAGLPVNANLITAIYNGDANFTGSSGNMTQTVRYLSGGICAGDAGHQILQPINADGTSIFNAKSTSPAKFRVCDANGVSISAAGVVTNFALIQILSGTLATTVNESVDSTTPDSNFRWDPTAQQWIFNISNKGLYGPNQTYYFRIMLNDGSAILFDYGLK